MQIKLAIFFSEISRFFPRLHSLNTGLAGKAATNHPHNDKQDKLNLLITESSGESNVASGLWTAIPSTNIAIVPGLYILYIEANFASNTNGKRGICILNTTTNV